MPLPDPYDGEPTAQIDPQDFQDLMQCRTAISGWEERLKYLKAKIEKQMGEAHAGMIGDRKVITNRPTQGYAESRLVKENEELAQHFMIQKVTEVLDLATFSAQHPDIASRYRIRQFRVA